MKRFAKIYVEISNICNLHCSFCPGTTRKPHSMDTTEFTALLPKLQPYTDFLYFHLMGEPLCHPQLADFLSIANDYGFKVTLTTNGTLLQKQKSLLLSSPALHKVNISLHAFEANDLNIPFSDYLDGCLNFAESVDGKFLITFRLWNQGGKDTLNQEILVALHKHFPGEWVRETRGTRISKRVYLEEANKFDWPDMDAPDYGERIFCYGLRDQIGILCDGTVVPCCLDNNGSLPIGNIFSEDLDVILNSAKARAIYDGFSKGKAAEEFCRHCGYAQRFHK